MKLKNIFVIFLFFCLNFAFSQNFVFDEASLLTKTEVSTLNTKLSSISKSSGVGVYIVTIEDYGKYGSSIEEAAERIYSLKKLGIGENNSGLLFLVSMADRSYDLDSYNNEIFTSKKRGRLENTFLDDFAENQWYSGFSDFVSKADSITQSFVNGEIDEDDLIVIVIGIIVILIISLIIGFMRLSSEKGKLNNIAFAEDATSYESEKGVNYSNKKDIFTHTTVKTIIHEESKSSSGGSGGHSHSSGHF